MDLECLTKIESISLRWKWGGYQTNS